MSARRQIIAALSEDSLGGIATLADVDHAEQLVDALVAEVLAEAANPVDAATAYATRTCVCFETRHPTWCPASVPTDARIAEIRQGAGEPLTARELSWLKGAAARHELHVTGARGGHWPLTDDLPDALLLVSQYLAAAMAVIERTAPPLTVFRASHESIVMGLYTTAAGARAHCEAEERRSWPKGTNLAFDWIEDEEDGVAELVVTAGQNEESVTGYVATTLEVASKYDEEADE